jgi:O-methyltransferase
MKNSHYLDLVELVLTGMVYEDAPMDPWSGTSFDATKRSEGLDWPSQAFSMIGWHRMRNLRELCNETYVNNVAGDFVECGVWRGGAAMMMAAVANLYEGVLQQRKIWLFDSFEGLPKPELQQDAGDQHHTYRQLKVSLEEVKRNFDKVRLLKDNVKFVKGWFKDTTPNAEVEQIAVLRVDGDMYQSTRDVLENLYPKVSKGGFVIIDDYNLPGARLATDEFLREQKIYSEVIAIDRMGVYWRK